MSKVDKLEMYSKYMNDEFGEYCTCLSNIGGMLDMMSVEFKKEYIKELTGTLEYIERNTRLVDKEDVEVHKYKYLEWLSYE